ncbi:MAG: phenylalanine--tRNA ligase subunit alpha [Kiritimatiellae bacterium]|nr:phenylalanine--tRNA ligase subunit alpha [Kiritimatiellia bacterium]
MTVTIEMIEALEREALGILANARTPNEVETARIKYLGRNGWLSAIMKGLKDVPVTERAAVGRRANSFKERVTSALREASARLAKVAAVARITPFDWSLPGRWHSLGTRHPVSLVIEETVRIFASLGFTVVEGPDIETAYYNFEALNTPSHHPSLDPRDTFWLADGILLRTQTSPVQVRVMESREPPVRIITAGRCYRRDTMDATHSANFHQIEGLYVDRQVSLADLKGTLAHFAREMMGADVKIRFRPHFFPFTEPSVECDFSCHVCHGQGCRVCKNTGWIEIAGAGMVDPRVFRKVGYPVEKVSGYAFGMGVERIAAIKYGITDIRVLYENDARFLAQFL